MTSQPTLTTERLLLRAFHLADAPRVKELAGEWEIAEMTAAIPHPYEDGMAEEWIATHAEAFEKGRAATFAVELHPDGPLVGAIDIWVNKSHKLGELGYWMGKAYWNQGYCTEAAKAVLQYGFGELGLHRIQARHMPKNPASGRVLEKIGMIREGVLRQSLKSFDTFEDAVIYSILQNEYEPQ